MKSLFSSCKSLKFLDLSNFSTQNVTNMGFMFLGCNSLKMNNVKTKDEKILKLLRICNHRIYILNILHF